MASKIGVGGGNLSLAYSISSNASGTLQCTFDIIGGTTFTGSIPAGNLVTTVKSPIDNDERKLFHDTYSVTQDLASVDYTAEDGTIFAGSKSVANPVIIVSFGPVAGEGKREVMASYCGVQKGDVSYAGGTVNEVDTIFTALATTAELTITEAHILAAGGSDLIASGQGDITIPLGAVGNSARFTAA